MGEAIKIDSLMELTQEQYALGSRPSSILPALYIVILIRACTGTAMTTGTKRVQLKQPWRNRTRRKEWMGLGRTGIRDFTYK